VLAAHCGEPYFRLIYQRLGGLKSLGAEPLVALGPLDNKFRLPAWPVDHCPVVPERSPEL